MNVLVVVAEMGSGGAEAVVGELARDLLARGSTVAIASSGGWRLAGLQTAGVHAVPVQLAGRRPLALLRAAVVLRRQLRRHRPDLVHAHNVKAALLVRLATLGMRRPPVVVTLHGVPDPQYRLAARILARVADRVVAVSADVAARVTAAGLPADRSTVIENAISPVAAGPRDEARAGLDLGPDVVVAVCIARLVPQKRHDLLVAAWRLLPPNTVLLIVGDGPTRPDVAAAVDAAGLADRVRLLGERRDVDRLLAAADLCVLATDWEGLPISLLEAMTARVPVVASAVGGLPDAIGGAARLVTPDSAEALADAVRELVENPQRRAALAAAGADLAATRFGAARMLDAYRLTYQTEMEHRGAAQP